MADEVKNKITLIVSDDRDDSAIATLKDSISKNSECKIEKSNPSSASDNFPETIIQGNADSNLILVDAKFSNKFTLNKNFEKIVIVNLDDPQPNESFLNLNRIQIKNISEAIFPQVIETITNPANLRGYPIFTEQKNFVLSQKLQSTNELGLLLDIILYFSKTKLGGNFSNDLGTRIAYSAITSESLRLVEEDKQPYPTLGIHFAPSPQGISYCLQFTLNATNALNFSDLLYSNDSIFGIVRKYLDFIQISYFEKLNEVEIKTFIQNNSTPNSIKNSTFIFQKISTEISQNQKPNPFGNIDFRSIPQLISDIPEEIRKKLYYFGIEKNKNGGDTKSLQNQEAAMAKLMNKKNMLVQQLSERVEQEQKLYSEKQKKINNILAAAKNELETTKKESSQYKSKIKLLEKQLHQSSSELNIEGSDDTEKMLDEVNSALRSANHSKTTAEDKLKLAERKIEILEKKYALAIRDMKKIDRDLVESKSYSSKISKEFEALQNAMKQQSSHTQVNVNNEEYEKKIKALSTKVYDQQQKELELQATIKKLSLKVEQSEIGKKSTKGQDDGKLKQLERQVEQAKIKERELLKKIEDLGLALKKVKSGKAA